MAVLKNRAKMSTSTTGTGTITLGSAESGYQTFGDAGVANADVVRYVIEDGAAWEIGTGTYTATGTTLTRTVSESSNADAAIVLTGSAVVFVGAAAEDIYTDANVDTHLNTSTATTGEVLSWSGTDYDWIAAGGGSPDLFAENYDGISTLPSATGTNALALQDGAVASANRSIAVGRDAVSSGNYSVALGVYTDAINSFGTALGYKAQTASGDYATALTNSRASGADSFAAAIANNTSSYGATGQESVAIGKQAKATGLGSLALSANRFGPATSSSNGSVAIGDTVTASGSLSLAMGYNTTASASSAIAIGSGITNSTANQVVLGGTTQQVKISNTYTLPTTDGTANQVLTTDGSGAVTFATAGGGSPDLFAENYDGTSTLPSATGTNAFAIGVLSTSSAPNSIAIGTGAYVTHQGGVGLGYSPTVTANYGVAIGGNSVGAGAKVSGAGGVALGGSNTQGSEAFSAVIDNTTTSYGASGANSVAIGRQAKATGQDAIAIGDTTTASGVNAIAFGNMAVASATKSTVIGGDGNAASGSKSVAIGGYYAEAREESKIAFGGGYIGTSPATHAYQAGLLCMGAATTDATATVLRSSNAAAGTTNQVILPNNSAYFFSGTIIAREQASAGTDVGAWEIKGAIRREANAASTVLVKSTIDDFNVPTGWAVALTADTTNGGLAITVTGAAATNIRWVATVNTSEVTY